MYVVPPQAKVLLIYDGMYSILCMFSDVWQTLVKHKTKIIEVQTKNTKTNKKQKTKNQQSQRKTNHQPWRMSNDFSFFCPVSLLVLIFSSFRPETQTLLACLDVASGVEAAFPHQAWFAPCHPFVLLCLLCLALLLRRSRSSTRKTIGSILLE